MCFCYTTVILENPRKKEVIGPMQYLRQWRQNRGWTQARLAQETGVHETTVRRWENGETSPYPYHRDRLLELGFEYAVSAPFDTPLSQGEETPFKMLPPLNPKQEHPSTYFVQDRSNQEEFDRLVIQDRMMTTSMGGVLPEQSDPSLFQRVLDVGCGTGGWNCRQSRPRRWPDPPR